MDLALERGYRSPWLQDNRARALMQLERFEEACDAWRLMEEQADTDHARRTADEMLAWLRPQSEQQRRWRQAEGHGERAAELLAAGDSEAAVAALVDGLGRPGPRRTEAAVVGAAGAEAPAERPAMEDLARLDPAP